MKTIQDLTQIRDELKTVSKLLFKIAFGLATHDVDETERALLSILQHIIKQIRENLKEMVILEETQKPPKIEVEQEVEQPKPEAEKVFTPRYKKVIFKVGKKGLPTKRYVY